SLGPDNSRRRHARRARRKPVRSSRRRFLLGLAAAAALPTLVAACGAPAASSPQAAAQAPTRPADAPNPAGSPEPARPAAAAPATKPGGKLDLGAYTGPSLTGQPIKLRLMRQVYAPDVTKWWQDRYAEWSEAYPNITFQEEVVPYGDLNTKLQ